jgi:ComF family protein
MKLISSNFLTNLFNEVALNSFFDFFLPRLCASCKNKLLPEEKIVCDECYSKLKIPDSSFLKEEYQIKFSHPKLIEDFRAGLIFEEDNPCRNMIHSLKYEKKYAVGIYLGRLVANIFSEEIKKWCSDFIIPVPLYSVKKSNRGYNQSEFIAKGISKELGIPCKKNLLKRIRHTQTQTKLNALERRINVQNAFKLKNEIELREKKVILVDDVVTTGSTILECANVLKKAGTDKIFALFAAIAV